MTPVTQNIEPADVTLKQALLLLGQVQVLGVHPRMGMDITVTCHQAHRTAVLACGAIVQRIPRVRWLC